MAVQTRPALQPPLARHSVTRLAVFMDSARERDGVLAAVAAVAGPRATVLVLHAGAGPGARRLVESSALWLRAIGLDAKAQALPAGMPEVWQLLARAREFDPNLIVMGTRGLEGASAVFAGSVSHEVMRHARCPVLVVPDGALVPAAGPVLVGWDDSGPSRAALRMGQRLSAGRPGSLQAVHVVTSGISTGVPSQLPPGAGWIEVDHDPDGIAATLNRVAGGLRARLVVIGTRRLSVLDALLLGSVGHDLLAISERPVLVTRC